MIYLLIPLVLFCLLFSFATYKRKEHAGKFAFKWLIHSITAISLISAILFALAFVYKLYQDNISNKESACFQREAEKVISEFPASYGNISIMEMKGLLKLKERKMMAAFGKTDVDTRTESEIINDYISVSSNAVESVPKARQMGYSNNQILKEIRTQLTNGFIYETRCIKGHSREIIKPDLSKLNFQTDQSTSSNSASEYFSNPSSTWSNYLQGGRN